MTKVEIIINYRNVELYLEIWNAVTFPQCYLIHLQAADVRSQTSKTLLAAASYTNEKSVTSRRLQDTIDTTAAKRKAHCCNMEENIDKKDFTMTHVSICIPEHL